MGEIKEPRGKKSLFGHSQGQILKKTERMGKSLREIVGGKKQRVRSNYVYQGRVGRTFYRGQET